MNEVQMIDYKGNKVYSKHNFNPFFDGFAVHHMNVEAANTIYGNFVYIPADSLDDVHLAKNSGARWIECNPQKCADGVWVCKHGDNGKLGAGIKALDGLDYSQTLFSSVTSTWLRENIVYDSKLAKFCKPIPTLDEFCAECKMLGLGITFGYSLEPLEIVRKYITDDKILIFSVNERPSGFGGIISVYWNLAKTPEENYEGFKKYGKPLLVCYPLDNAAFDASTDEEISSFVKYCHDRGDLVGGSYMKPYEVLRARRLGFDEFAITGRTLNLFEDGTELNVCRTDDSSLVLGAGVTYDSTTQTLSIPANSEIYIEASTPIQLGKVCYDICFSGEASIICGAETIEHNLLNVSSNGDASITNATLIQRYSNYDSFSRWITIKAITNTTIKDLKVHCSYIG